MSENERVAKDPLIEEVRARRQRLLEAHGNSLDALCKTIEKLQREHPEKMVDLRRTTSEGG